jgi:hypothetical protein
VGLLVSAIVLASLINLAATGQFRPTSTNFWYNFYCGNNPLAGVAELRYDSEYPHPEAAMLRYLGITDSHQVTEASLRKGSLTFAMGHPLNFLWGLVLKLARFCDVRLDGAEDNNLLENMAYSIPKMVYMPLAFFALGTIIFRNDRFAAGFFLTWFVCFAFPEVLLFGLSRIRVPSDFMMVVLAMHAAIRKPEYKEHNV